MSSVIDLASSDDGSSSDSSSKSEILQVIGEIKIRQSDIDRLRPRRWLNDSIVIGFMCVLNARDAELCSRGVISKRSYFFNSLLIPLLMEDSGGYNFNKVRRMPAQAPGGNIFSLLRLFIPVCIDRSHWTLLVVHIPDKIIKYYDSMGNIGDRYLRCTIKFLRDTHFMDHGCDLPDLDTWRSNLETVRRLPQQVGGFDCGVFVCARCEYIYRDIDLRRFTQADVLGYRDQIKHSILNWRPANVSNNDQQECINNEPNDSNSAHDNSSHDADDEFDDEYGGESIFAAAEDSEENSDNDSSLVTDDDSLLVSNNDSSLETNDDSSLVTDNNSVLDTVNNSSFVTDDNSYPLFNPVQEIRPERPHPSNRGSHGYNFVLRHVYLQLEQMGIKLNHPSRFSLWRWKRYGLERKKKTGGKRRRYMSGENLFLLCLFKKAHPDGTGDETRVFILRSASQPHYFGRNEISRGLGSLGMTRKKASTDAKQAYTPINIFKRYLFFNSGYPTGVQGTPRKLMMDMDECGLMLSIASRTFGHAVKHLRVRKKGNYCRDTKVTVILAIEPGDPDIPDGRPGSLTNPRRWFRVNLVQGTTAEEFSSFVLDDIVGSFEDNEPSRTMMWDNLNSHLDPNLYDQLFIHGHRPICRPPWNPSDGPIEWVFNQLGCWLRMMAHEIDNFDQLMNAVEIILTNLTGFNETFVKCGYT